MSYRRSTVCVLRSETMTICVFVDLIRVATIKPGVPHSATQSAKAIAARVSQRCPAQVSINLVSDSES